MILTMVIIISVEDDKRFNMKYKNWPAKCPRWKVNARG
jgi:hypothetical protein